MRIRSNSILWGNFYAIIIVGMITLFIGTNMPNIREYYQLTYEQGGLILSLYAAGGLFFGLISGVVGDITGMKRMLLTIHVLFIIGLGIIFISKTALILYIGVFLIGSGAGAFTTVANIVVNDYTHGDGKIMSLFHMCFGVGAFIIPIIASEFLKLGLGWKSVLFVLAVLEVISIVITFTMKLYANKDHTHESKPSAKKALMNKRLYIFMGILFFYVGSENVLNGWMVTYLTKGLAFSDHFSQQMLSLFWIVMMAGRYMNSIISQKFYKENIIAISSIGAVVFVFLFMKASSPISIIIITALTGLMFSGMYPITFANANSVIKGSGAAGAILTSAGSTGSIFIPYISGLAAENTGVMGILYTIIITLSAMCVFSLINKKMQTEYTTSSNSEAVV